MFTRNTIVLGTLTTTFLAGTAVAEDVLILDGGDLSWSQDLASKLNQQGHDCVVGPSFWEFTGQDLDEYDAVIVLAVDLSPNMPVSGQNALIEFIEDGGGLLTAEAFNYTLRWGDNPLEPITPVAQVGAIESSIVTYSRDSPDAVLHDGLPYEFSFPADGYGNDYSEINFDEEGGETYYTSATGASVVGREYGNGRVLCFNTFMSPVSNADPNYIRLVANGVRWSTVGGLRGAGAGERFGTSIVNIGDVYTTNDFIIGAPHRNNYDHDDAGAAYVVYGDTPWNSGSWDGGWETPAEPGDRLGWSVTPMGDVTGEGMPDWAVSAPRDDTAGTNAGAVYIVSGGFGLIRAHHGEAAGDQFGYSIAGGLDYDGDGVGDLLVGAPKHDAGANNTGAAYVYSGATGALLDRFEGEAKTDLCGWSVALIPDIDGDGRAECLVGEPKNDRKAPNAGRVTMYSDGENVGSVKGNQQGARFGFSMAPVGDVNWDGYVDIAIGSPYFDKGAKSNSGRVDLLSGATGDRLWKVKGGKAGQRLGHCVANAGDINGDGINDVVAGAPKYGENRGRVYVRDGWSGTGIARLTGENDGDRFGTAVAGNITSFDPDSPGIGIGAPRVDSLTHSDAGQVYIVQFDDGFAFAGPIGGGEFSGDIDMDIPDPCDADLNGDDAVDGTDLMTLISIWGPCDCEADLNGDGFVDGHDLMMMVATFGVCEND